MLDMLGRVMGGLAEDPGGPGALLGEGAAAALAQALGGGTAPARPAAAPADTRMIEALGGTLLQGIDAEEALILLVPHLEVSP